MYRSDPDELAAARAELVRYGARLLADGLSVGSAGNLSVRVGDAVAITPSGVAYPEMTPAGHLPGHALDGARSVAEDAVRRAGDAVLRDADAPGDLRGDQGGGGRAHALARGHRAVGGANGAAGHPLRDHRASAARSGSRPTRGSGRRGWPRPPSRRWTAAARSSCATTARSPTATDLAQAYDRALLLEWLARTYRLALSYGEPAVLSAAELDEVTAESRRRRYGSGPRTASARRSRDRARAARPLGPVTVLGRPHPGRARPAGRGHPARPGQRPAHRDPGHRRGHGGRHRPSTWPSWAPACARSARSATTCSATWSPPRWPGTASTPAG